MNNNLHKNCLICNSSDIKELTKYSNNFLVKCNSCGLVFCEPIPSQQELNNYYKVYAYENNYYSPITKQRYIELLKKFEQFRVTNNLLDVGCGNGFFLEVAKNHGWNVYGTEYSEKAIEILQEKRIKAFKGELNINNFKPEMFDIITSFEVMEHINNPQEEIRKFNYLLRKEGGLYITTPNFNSVSRNLLKQKWNIINFPEHLTYYSVKTLKQLLINNGFEKKYSLTTGFSISRYRQSKSIKELKTETTVKNIDENLRKKLEKKALMFYFVKIVNILLSFFNKGDTIKVFYIKTISK